MKKALITGVTGFAGSFLAENLLTSYEVSGTYLSDKSLANVSEIKDKISLHKIDLQDERATSKLILQEKPDYIFHLAALTSPSDSFKNPKECITNNISSQLNILEGIKKAEIFPRVLVVSSAEVYGKIRKSDLPIDENTPLAPVNPYAISKIAQAFLGVQYFHSYKIPVIVARPFNHIGPRQSPSFVVASFASKIASIEKGGERALKVGNLSAKRDLTDVRDIVRGYRLLLEKGEPGQAYNIGQGKSFKIEDVLSMLISQSKVKIKVEVDESRLRPIDIAELVCDNTKIKEKTGWTPEIDIAQSLKNTLDYWRGIT